MKAARGTDAPALIEREDEGSTIEEALAAARSGSGSLVLIEGPAGIGKTELVRAARAAASREGMGVAAARGSELERELAFGVVRQLLEPAVAEGPGDLLGGAAASAEALFLAPRAGEERQEDQSFAMLHGLYWVCANLAQQGPLVLVVDDAHWADVASLRFVAYLAQRREDLPLALLVAARPAESPAEEALLTKLATDPLAVIVNPTPLSREGTAALLTRAFETSPEPGFVDACHLATGGTPFLVTELTRDLHARGLQPVDGSAGVVADLGPRTIARALLARMRQLAPGAVELARAAAVLGREAEPRRAALLADMEIDQALGVLDSLSRTGVVSPSRPIEFTHPIVRSAVYSDIPAGERARLHAQAARLLADEALATERIAGHLLATVPSGDPWAVETLLSAASVALSRGAPTSAIPYLERALAEPPGEGALVDVLHDLGRAEAADGRGTDHLRRALSVCPEPDRRVRIGLDLARAIGSAAPLSQVVDAFQELQADLDDPDSGLARQLEAELYMFGLNYWPALEVVLPRVRLRIEQMRAGELDDPALLGPIAVVLAVNRPPASKWVEIAERAGDAGFEANTLLPGGAGNAFLFAGELERAGEVYDRAIADARSRGSRLLLGWTSAFRGHVTLQQGHVARATEETRLGYELMSEVAGAAKSWGVVWSAAYLIEALVAAGELEEAEATVAGTAGWEAPDSHANAALMGARGRLRFAQLRPEDALKDALASALSNPDANPAVRPWRSDAAHALRLLGRVDEGRGHAEQELALAREYDVPHAIAVALRALAACSEGRAEIELLEEAVTAAEASEARLELARALVELGAALRRQKQRQACRGPLRRGLDLALRCRATPLADRAHTELRATGARPRTLVLTGVEALTPSELRAAEMAAEGMTNREIAQTLFVTPRTVETHLTHAYQKLDISSREELPGALDAPSE